jgi:hypothetical protein
VPAHLRGTFTVRLEYDAAPLEVKTENATIRLQ